MLSSFKGLNAQHYAEKISLNWVLEVSAIRNFAGKNF